MLVIIYFFIQVKSDDKPESLTLTVRTIFYLRKRNHVSKHRQSLRWLEVADRAKLKVAFLT